MARQEKLTPLEEFRGAARNPKEHDIPTIRASLRRWGFTSPVIIDERTGTMVAGHGRIEALREMQRAKEQPPSGIVERGGQWLVPAVRGIRFASREEAEAYLVADNRLTMMAGWDSIELGQMLAEQSDLSGIGFTEDEIAALNDLEGDLPSIGDVGDPETQQMTFILTREQVAVVRGALRQEKARLSLPEGENSNGSALASICERAR